MKAARYLNWRINRQVSLEDTGLINRVQDGMGSKSFSVGPAGRDGSGLAQFLPPHAHAHSRIAATSRAGPRLEPPAAQHRLTGTNT